MKDSAFENFSEDAQNVLDFARCQRPDGSFYGTGGQCRKGSPTGAKEKTATRTRPKAAIESDMKKLSSSGAMAAKGTAGVKAREAHAALKAELKKPLAGAKQKEAKAAKSKASDKAKSSEAQAAGKKARKEMIAARDKEKELRAARKTAEAGDDKKAAAVARRAHIDSKKEMKAAAQRFRDRQTANNDMRRFGRQEERDKASIKQLQEALKSGKLSPTKQAAVERDIRMRTAREKSATATAKASKDPAVQKRLLQTEIKKVSAKYEKLRGKPEAAAERKKLMDRASEIVKKLGKIDAAASKAAGPKKPDTSLLAQQRRSSAAARARD